MFFLVLCSITNCRVPSDFFDPPNAANTAGLGEEEMEIDVEQKTGGEDRGGEKDMVVGSSSQSNLPSGTAWLLLRDSVLSYLYFLSVRFF